jgi:hypothetical protein
VHQVTGREPGQGETSGADQIHGERCIAVMSKHHTRQCPQNAREQDVLIALTARGVCPTQRAVGDLLEQRAYVVFRIP